MASINLDRSSRLDIRCRKGDTFKLIFKFDDAQTSRPIGGWKMQVRPTADHELTPELDVVNGGTTYFVYSDNDKTLTLTIPAGTMDFSGQYVYDIQHAGDETETFFHGVFTAVEDVTNT
jgi:hypothetical protein